jgi:hypothetical protein
MSKIGIQIRGSGAVMRKYLRGGGLAKRGTGVALKGGGRAAKFGGGRTNLLEELGRVEAERSNPNRRAEISRVHGELNRGYKDGGRAGFRNGGSSMQQHYLQHGYGPHKKRKRNAIGGRQWSRRPEKSFIEHAGGSEKGKPHSTKEGRIASGTRRIKRFLQSSSKPGKPKRGPQAPLRPGPYIPNPRRKLPEPGERKTLPDPRRKPGEKREYQPAATGGRIGLKKGGSDKNWIQKATASIKKRGTKGKCTPITKKGCTGRAKALAKTFKKMAAKRKA